jgi:uncharacterized RDD family membrane protein YckC
MPASGITVLKNNAPWGPFTRAQIEDGLARGDYTVKYLAHTPGLKEWLPLGEVLHHLDVNEGSQMPSLPPVPERRELPPVPGSHTAMPVPKPAPLHPATPAPQPPMLPKMDKPEIKPELPVKPKIVPEPELKSAFKRETPLVPASFFPRGIAFLIDCAILFVPVIIIFILGAGFIWFSGLWDHNPESVRQKWALLERNMKEMACLVAVGFGWLYGAGYECSSAQATIGKRWVGLKVTDENGERISFLRATGRYAAKYLSALPCFLGFMLALFSSTGRTLHDRLAETRVVRK